MCRRRLFLDHSILLIITLSAVLFSCNTTKDLVLDDPAFQHDMVEDAIDGKVFKITPDDYPEIRQLFSDERPSYRLAGVILAAQSGNEMFSPMIAAAALDSEPEVSQRAVEVMKDDPERYRDTLFQMLKDENPQVRTGALKLLGGNGSEDLVPLLITFFNDSDPTVRNQASLSVRNLTDRNNPFLREALEADDPLTVSVTIRTFGGYGDVRDMDIFIDAFAAEDATIRREAQLAALKVGVSGLPMLHDTALDTDSGYRVRLSSLEIIQGLRSPESLETLIGLLVDPDTRIAGKAQSILGTYGLEAVPALEDLYRRSDVDNRIHAVRLLDEIGAPSAYPVLAEALGDESTEVQVLAYQALLKAAELAWPALHAYLAEENKEIPPNIAVAISILLEGADPSLAITGDGEVNTEGLFLVIISSSRRDLQDYLETIGAKPLISETVLALKDAWEVGDEFAVFETDIATGNDPYLLVWRQWEQLSVASREALKKSFERLHDYFDSRDPQTLDDSREIRTESRLLESEARALKEKLADMSPQNVARGEERLIQYRTTRDFLVRTWEYIIPALRPLAEKVYADRNLDPQVLSRESALLD